MPRVLVNGYWDHGKKKEIRSYAIYGGLIPPFTMKLNGERYIMPGWYKLRTYDDMPNIEDIGYYPYKPKKANIPNIDKDAIYKVKSSKGNKEYIIQMNNSGSLQCTCPGYVYRRKCRHIEEVANR